MTLAYLTEPVLVLTQQNDFGADAVIQELHDMGTPVFRWDPSSFPLRSEVRACIGREGPWTSSVSDGKRSVQLEDIRSVWYRRPRPFELPATFGPVERDFAYRESHMAIGGLLRKLDCLWVNHPEKITAADYKPYQLSLASNVGLEIPSTLLTNDPDAVEDFFHECGGAIIYKTLSYPMVGGGDGEHSALPLFTSKVTSDNLARVERVRYSPCLLQENVPKKVELRLTIVGTDVFPAQVYSQEHEISETDWRKGVASADVKLRYGVHPLPDHVRDRCLRLARALQLEYAAVDLILTPDDRYVFLEVNPVGEWGWIQAETGMNIARRIAEHLTTGMSSAGHDVGPSAYRTRL